MKRILLLLISIILITSCSKPFAVKTHHIVQCKINDTIIQKNDYLTILDSLKQLHFSKRHRKMKEPVDTISIITEDNIYSIKIGNNFLSVQTNGVKYYSYNKKNIQYLKKQIKNILEKYYDENFYTIKYITKYNETENKNVIKIDNVNNYFVIRTTIPIQKIRINKVEKNHNKYQDIDVVYQSDKLQNKNLIKIRVNPFKEYFRYRIEITNIYGLTVSIIPTYNIEKETGNLIYVTESYRKE